jgi:flavin reductase (DIM6/NTAB) family NADH-FMN oxidoreductase RutF
VNESATRRQESPTLAPQTRAFGSAEFRQALGTFATGVTLITTAGEHPYGMTANAFSSVSLDPPLVLVCIIKGTSGAEAIEQSGVFAVNILHAEQEAISRFFSSRDRPRGWDAFREIPYRLAVTGAPILEGAAGYLDCRLAAAHEAGDHVIYVGEVLALDADAEARPLLFHGGRYQLLAD